MIRNIKKWFETAIPEPTIEQACIQVGCHYEEVAEMMDPLSENGDVMDDINALSREYKSLGADHIEHLQMLSDKEKVDILDSLCDQIVTAIGVAHMLGMDIEGALSEVNDSNYSKFEDNKPVFNEQGKVGKGKYYKPPQLDRFI